MIKFTDISARDRELIQRYTLHGTGRNCDLSFANLISWRFLYDTQYAIVDGYLVFRFYTGRHMAYMTPIPKPEIQPDGTYTVPSQSECPVQLIMQLRDDAIAMGYPFLLIGVSNEITRMLEQAMPGKFNYRPERNYFDYIYTREQLATLAGKHLQGKRNHCNKFRKLYPDYEYRELTKDMIPECLRLEQKWRQSTKQDAEAAEDSELSEELRSMTRAFINWDYIGSLGGALYVNSQMVAFTYGCPITADTFDVCVEKADVSYEGAFSMINQEFARHLPEQYVYMNREEDLGEEGLRRAKLSYKPAILLEKYSITEKEPLRQFEDEARIKSETRQLYIDTFHDSEEFTELYFSRMYRPERNVACQIDNHVCAALQTLPYQLQCNGHEVKADYIYGVCVQQSMRRQNVGSNLMKQTHHRLYYRGTVFSVLIPAEPWLFDWYASLGYTQAIRSVAPPDNVRNMSYREFDAWQRARNCMLLQSPESFDVAQTDLKACPGETYPAVPGMLRVINACAALRLYATLNPDFTANIRVYNDKDVAENNIYFALERGKVMRTDRPLPNARALTIGELGAFIMAGLHPVMTLMLN